MELLQSVIPNVPNAANANHPSGIDRRASRNDAYRVESIPQLSQRHSGTMWDSRIGRIDHNWADGPIYVGEKPRRRMPERLLGDEQRRLDGLGGGHPSIVSSRCEAFDDASELPSPNGAVLRPCEGTINVSRLGGCGVERRISELATIAGE